MQISDLPSWTSQAVAALGPAQAELLGRLTSEPRMKRVWREFGRRRRSDGAPLYPVEALKLLLMEVLKLTKERAYVIPRRDARLATFDDRLDDVGRQIAEPQNPADMGVVELELSGDRSRVGISSAAKLPHP